MVITDIVLINLDRDVERLEQSKRELEKFDISFERIPGVYNPIPWKGFNKAYMNALRAIPSGGIIFEDDIELDSFYIPDLPKGWDMLYFGCNLQEPTDRINDELVRVFGAWTTHAILYSAQCVKNILREFDPEEVVYDEWLRREFCRRNNCYMTTPMQAYQRDGYSNLMKTQANYRAGFDSNYNKFTGR